MRLLLFTGKGGVGKTTMAAATAAVIAGRGRKTLLVSTDSAHSLADALGVELGPDPVEVAPGLAAMQVDSQARFEQGWREIARYLRDLLTRGGGPGLAAEELAVLPGAEEVLSLLAVRDQAAGGRWDAVVVDCAPTAETLRLLALPEALAWYLERVFPTHRRIVRTLSPFRGATGLPGDGVLDAVTRLNSELLEVRTLLADVDTTSVRLVLTPEEVVVAEARRTLTSLSLYGYRVDSVIANRVVPADGDDPWRLAWARAQGEQLTEVRASFPGVPIRLVPYAAGEPVGLAALTDLGTALYGDDDPAGPAPGGDFLALSRAGDDRFELTIALPHARSGEVDLARSGDELVLTVAGHRRLLALPGVLRRCLVESADLTDGRLRIVFTPDPALWPSP